jgi:hypothetical protein
MEKMAYAVVMAKRKLQHYFQSHNVSVPTTFPFWDMFENKESTGRMGKWAIELAEHVINFVACSAIKSQVLADFVVDWTPSAPKGGSYGHGASMGSSMRWCILPPWVSGSNSPKVPFGHQASLRPTAEL